METSANTMVEKDQMETEDSEESKENHVTKSMDFVSKVTEMIEVKLIEHSEPIITEISNQTNVSSNETETPMEILSEQLIDHDNKSGNQIETDNTMFIDNEVTVAEKNELNNKCLKSQIEKDNTSNESETPMEILTEQLIDHDNKSGNQIETDNTVFIDNEVIVAEENELNNKCLKSQIEKDDTSNKSETLMEILGEQLIDHDNKSGNQIEKDNTMSVDNEVIVVEKNELNKKCSKSTENSDFSGNTMENPTRTENFDNTSDLYIIDNCSSLQSIAVEYDSSDAENENENKNKNDSSTKVSNSNVYRNTDEVVITDSESSDSESDSSSSESESDAENACSKSNSDDSDEERPKNTNGNKSTKVFKPKSEFDDLPPIEDLKISVPEVLCDPLGEVAWTVEQMVVVRPKPGKPTLNLDTVLFIEKGQRALGHIFDVFGQVAEPHYCVRFNSSDHIRECDIKVGMTVYYCPNTQYTSLVFLSELTKMKAVDDIGDDEPPQFSDDEEEQAYLASLKKKQNNKKVQESSSETPNKRKRVNKTGWQSNHPWNSNKDHQQNVQPHSSKPFYRTHHPWSRPRYPPQNQWHPQNFYPNQWMGQYPPYNQMEVYNHNFPQTQTPQGQWNPRYQMPQFNTLPLQGAPPTFVPPFNFPPPPPPPPPSTSK